MQKAGTHRIGPITIVGEGVIQAFNVCTGEFLWKIEVKGFYVTTFQIYKERVYLTGIDGELYCLKINTGETLWKYAIERAHTSDMKDNLILVGTMNGNLIALSRYPLFLIIV